MKSFDVMQSIPIIIINGRPGTGKTVLSSVIQDGFSFHETSSHYIECPDAESLDSLFSRTYEDCLIVIDEAHRTLFPDCLPKLKILLDMASKGHIRLILLTHRNLAIHRFTDSPFLSIELKRIYPQNK